MWQQHGEWVTQHRPSFGPGVKERFQAAAAITQQQFEDAAQQRAAVRQRVAEVVGSDGVLLLPTAPGPPPLRGLSGDEVDRFRTSLICLTCIAGLSGFPQVGLCVGRVLGWEAMGPATCGRSGIAETMPPMPHPHSHAAGDVRHVLPPAVSCAATCLSPCVCRSTYR